MQTTQSLELPPLVKSDTSSDSVGSLSIITGGRWAFRGESIWSIFHKLAYLNDFSARDIVSCFGTVDVKSRPLGRVGERDLRIRDGFDEAKIAAAVGLSIEDVRWSFFDHYKLDPSSRGASVLRYCPECIKLGVHAALQQLPALLECPWHAVPLESACPSCGGVQFYELDTDYFRHPYLCQCGYQFWPDLGNTPWVISFEESKSRYLDEFVDWIAPVRTARGGQSRRKVILLEDERDHISLDEVLLELNRIYPGPAWLGRCLGDPLIQEERNPKRLVSARRPEMLAVRAASRDKMRIKIECMLDNPIDTYFVANVLEPAQATLQRLKMQIRRVFLKNHTQCVDEIVFVNNQLYTANRSGTACLWASVYAMWDEATYHLFDKTPVSVPLVDTSRIPADHLGIYLKWQQLLWTFVHDQAEMIDKDILDLLVIVFQRWLRIRLFQEFLYGIRIIEGIIDSHNISALDGEMRRSLSTHMSLLRGRPLTFVTIELEPPSIRAFVSCSYNGLAAARAAHNACRLDVYTWWKETRHTKGYTFIVRAPQDRIYPIE